MSFIAYVLRAQTQLVQPFATDIPVIVIRMLKDIPPESSPSRRELIIAARHILGTEYRTFFTPFLNDLMDIRIFIGTGITSFESLRHLVYSTIAELVQHTKADLKPAQIKAVLMDFMAVLHDPTTSTTTQAMASKVISSLVDYIGPARFEAQEAIRICRWSMENFVRKLEALAATRAHQLAAYTNRRQQLLTDLISKQTLPKVPDKAMRKESKDVGESADDNQTQLGAGQPQAPSANKERMGSDQTMIEKAKILGCVTCVVEPLPEQSKGTDIFKCAAAWMTVDLIFLLSCHCPSLLAHRNLTRSSTYYSMLYNRFQRHNLQFEGHGCPLPRCNVTRASFDSQCSMF